MRAARVAVVGGGIAGLAAAWTLSGSGAAVTVFEPGPVGGKLKTTDFCGLAVDEGADAFIARVPEGLELCRSLGLEEELVAPAASRALLWADGGLRPFPEGLVLGVPTRLGPLWRSGVVSRRGTARAALDLLLPATRWRGDPSVASLVAARVGREVLDRLVDPLVGGIHAGRTEDLSAEAAAPQLAAAARSSRSLMRGLRPAAATADQQTPLFLAPRGGMGRVVERLGTELRARGVEFAPVAVSTVAGESEGRVAISTPGPPAVFDAAILAVSARAAARLVGKASPRAASGLDDMEAASVVVVTLGFPESAAPRLTPQPDVSGFLVPRPQGRLMTACSIGSAKWPHWARPGMIVLRVSAGRAGDDRAMQLEDRELIATLTAELRDAVGVNAPPAATRISRWPGGFPQYRPGHFDAVAAITSALASDLPGVSLAGASYRGVGVPACIASGGAAAADALRHSAAISQRAAQGRP